mmetsp:Transcript_13955/g.35124  ORF Transcript_13955/g.35124 Transcript_13955/m.35124 type:complete len:280 (+) Transcript_13955:914-1753(+)
MAALHRCGAWSSCTCVSPSLWMCSSPSMYVLSTAISLSARAQSAMILVSQESSRIECASSSKQNSSSCISVCWLARASVGPRDSSASMWKMRMWSWYLQSPCSGHLAAANLQYSSRHASSVVARWSTTPTNSRSGKSACEYAVNMVLPQRKPSRNPARPKKMLGGFPPSASTGLGGRARLSTGSVSRGWFCSSGWAAFHLLLRSQIIVCSSCACIPLKTDTASVATSVAARQCNGMPMSKLWRVCDWAYGLGILRDGRILTAPGGGADAAALPVEGTAT